MEAGERFRAHFRYMVKTKRLHLECQRIIDRPVNRDASDKLVANYLVLYMNIRKSVHKIIC